MNHDRLVHLITLINTFFIERGDKIEPVVQVSHLSNNYVLVRVYSFTGRELRDNKELYTSFVEMLKTNGFQFNEFGVHPHYFSVEDMSEAE